MQMATVVIDNGTGYSSIPNNALDLQRWGMQATWSQAI